MGWSRRTGARDAPAFAGARALRGERRRRRHPGGRALAGGRRNPRRGAASGRAGARAEIEQIITPVLRELPEGQRVELRSEPVPYAGIYAPGGKASYPSSLLMCAIPARVAGVGRIAVASPPSAASARPSTAVLAACAVAGIDEVYAIGGAQ